jgi:D-amino-acid dehydrogenase
MPEQQFDIAVIGAGIVGVSTALWAAMRGKSVIVIDPESPGSGASFGNACTIATYGCLPINSPSIYRRLPRLLTDPESPLAFDWFYAIQHPRWMLSFLANCRPAAVDHITMANAILLSHADAGLNPLIAEADAQDLMVENDVLYLYSTTAGFEGARQGIQKRRDLGVALDVLDAAEIKELEPQLRFEAVKGLRFNGARHISSPKTMIMRMMSRALAIGARHCAMTARKITEETDCARVYLSDGTNVKAAHVVIAAGAHARSITGSGAEKLPLDTERGYPVMFPDDGAKLSRPCGWEEAGFYAVPMADGLRFAGTVEIAGLKKPHNRRRTQYIETRANRMISDLGRVGDTWMGFRPTFPDSLPAIGKSPKNGRVFHAYGHQHLGLTLGGITGRTIVDLIEGKRPNFDLSPYDPGRF